MRPLRRMRALVITYRAIQKLALLPVVIQLGGCLPVADAAFGVEPDPPPRAVTDADSTMGGDSGAGAGHASASVCDAEVPCGAATGGSHQKMQGELSMPRPSTATDNDEDAGLSNEGTAWTADADGGEPGDGTDTDPGRHDGQDVVVIGDSWMRTGGTGVGPALQVASGQPYRIYAHPGRKVLDPGNLGIPAMFTQAQRDDPDIRTVVMNGGINDIGMTPGLLADCRAMGEGCQRVYRQILDRLSALWSDMAMAGVRDVIYVQYSDRERTELMFKLKDGDDVAGRCTAVPAPLRCHRIETGEFVQGDLPDRLHPTTNGYDRIGHAVYDLMKAQRVRR